LRLLVDEVVTNSVTHGGVGEDGRILLAIAVREDRIRVDAWDTGRQGTPQLRSPDVDGGHGFGLFLVSSIATAWGAEHDPALRVWFELARTPGGDAVPAAPLAPARVARRPLPTARARLTAASTAAPTSLPRACSPNSPRTLTRAPSSAPRWIPRGVRRTPTSCTARPVRASARPLARWRRSSSPATRPIPATPGSASSTARIRISPG
jgi:hypothetical protein